jgi:probable F420-dependent oxidoreductase
MRTMVLTLGLATPVVTRTRVGPEWLASATIEDVATVVAAADRLGYDFCTCSEHVGIPDTEIGRRGAAYWDPLATFSFLAARTSSIRFVTWVLVLAYHHPLELAKRYGQLDLMSGGRLVLGVGVGTLREEFDALGATYEDRGPRADDAIRALRAVWGRREPEYHGPHYEIGGLVVEPHAPRTDVPIWVGGRTRRSLRRAIELGDGWSPFALSLDEVRDALTWSRSRASARAPAAPPLAVMVSAGFTPLTDPARTRRTLERVEGAGVTHCAAGFDADSPAHFVEQLEALDRLVER